MNIHEYQGKELLARYNVKVPQGRVAFTVQEAIAAAEEIKSQIYVDNKLITECELLASVVDR